MELNDEAKAAGRGLGDAINKAIAESEDVSEAIEHLRSIGYEPHLTLKLEIALGKADAGDDEEPVHIEADGEMAFTDEDRKALQLMKIRFD